jgi:hypothetical protein
MGTELGGFGVSDCPSPGEGDSGFVEDEEMATEREIVAGGWN